VLPRIMLVGVGRNKHPRFGRTPWPLTRPMSQAIDAELVVQAASNISLRGSRLPDATGLVRIRPSMLATAWQIT